MTLNMKKGMLVKGFDSNVCIESAIIVKSVPPTFNSIITETILHPIKIEIAIATMNIKIPITK